MKKLLRGGIIATIGYLLSPLSWWNDAFVNIPLAYLFASLVALIDHRLFPMAMVAGYWLTNIAGVLLLDRGARDLTGRTGARTRKRLLLDLAAGTVYTVLIAALAFTGVIKPPTALWRKRPASPSVPVHFAREEISLRIHPGRVEVTGVYHFRSLSDSRIAAGMLYPFPLDSIHAYPDSIAVAGHSFERTDSGIVFPMSFRPGAETSFTVYYRQPLRRNAARYIVTTTRQWGRALDTADFRITLPAGFTGVELSYRPDSISRNDSTITYRFTKREFYPDRDVIVSWR